MSRQRMIYEQVQLMRDGHGHRKDTPSKTTFMEPTVEVIYDPDPDMYFPIGWTTASRLPPDRSTGSCRGYHPYPIAHRILVSESAMEYRAGIIMLADRSIKSIQDQPPAIKYLARNGVLKSHTPDYLTISKDNKRTSVDVKPKKSVKNSSLDETLNLISKQVGTHYADKYVVLTEHEITRLRTHNAEFIILARSGRNHHHIKTALNVISRLRGAVQIGHLAARVAPDGLGLIAIINLIDDGVLELTETQYITMRAYVARASCS